MKKRDFDHVYKRGHRARRDGLTVWVARRDGGGPARLGVALRASVGSAVDRNRTRRRIRHAFRDAGVPAGVDVIVRGDESLPSADFQELATNLVAALEDAGLELPA